MEMAHTFYKGIIDDFRQKIVIGAIQANFTYVMHYSNHLYRMCKHNERQRLS